MTERSGEARTRGSVQHRCRRFESTHIAGWNVRSLLDQYCKQHRAVSGASGRSGPSGMVGLQGPAPGFRVSPKRDEVRGARLPAAGRWPFPRPVRPFSVLLPGRMDLHGPSWSARLELSLQRRRTLLTFAVLEDSIGTSTAVSSEEVTRRRAAAELRSEDQGAACGRSALQRGSVRSRAPGGAASGQVSRSHRSGREPDVRSGWRGSCAGHSRFEPQTEACGCLLLSLGGAPGLHSQGHGPSRATRQVIVDSSHPLGPPFGDFLPKEFVSDPTGSWGWLPEGSQRGVLPDSSHG
jgi:hypothetical protein